MDRISSAKIRDILPGESRRFSTPTEGQVDSARALVARIGRHLKCRFSVTRDAEASVLVTRYSNDDKGRHQQNSFGH